MRIKIGVLRGNFYSEDFRKLEINYEESADFEALLMKLLNNRIDAIIEVRQVLQYKIKTLNLPESKKIKSILISDYKNSPSMLII